ncbi:Undecaprenyl pyrophosphate synthetase family protein [Perilla frutescens var. hirtella]|uniref:Alkyl transferase n=1 Tax=Perilla frutescens var. hirtella TaxID=608512 RepID=A0AAD4JN65_PERFH|nr:Undecaprenyl pyrophosphate synthetase family protein [Perilla frutescens var. hirtella]
MVSLHLRLSLTPSPLKLRRQVPGRSLDLKLPPRVFSSTIKAATVNGHPGEDILLSETTPAHFSGEDSAALPAGLRRESMPRHVAVIMDGNRRWARMKGLPIGSGYEAGVRALRKMVELCCNLGIRVLTVFAFSSDNWFRPKVEVDFLMRLFESGLRQELQYLMSADVRISIMGDSSKLLNSLQALLANAMETTENNSRLHLIIAVNYSGQSDVVQACQKLAVKVKDGLIEPKDINELLVESELGTNCTDFPHPDLLIRTSGELRVSNFLLWQLAHTELYFTHSHWPDFGENEFLDALSSFQERQRRYGC